MRINTNVSSLTAQENAVNTNRNIQNSLEKLSSGLRINKASDDASGLSIADKLRTQATSINQGVANGNSAITLMQIADKSMAEQSNILDVVKAKLIQANTDTTSDEGREAIRKDISKLLEQLDNIAEQTNYNGNTLLQSSATSQDASTALSFQIGESNADLISNTAIRSNTAGLGLAAQEETTVTLTAIDNATYSITIGSGSTDASGNAITAQTISFTTSGSATVSGVHAGLVAALAASTGASALVTAAAYDATTASGSLVLTAVDNNTALNIDTSAVGTSGTASGITLATTTTGTGAASTVAFSASFSGVSGLVSGDTFDITIGGTSYSLTGGSGFDFASGASSTGIATALTTALSGTNYTATASGGNIVISETTGGISTNNSGAIGNITFTQSGTSGTATGSSNSGATGVDDPTAHVQTATITAAGAGTNRYTLTVASGATVTFDATSGMTAAQIQDGLIAAATASGGIAASGGSYTIASGSSGSELTITSNTAGASGVVTSTGEYATVTDSTDTVSTAAGTGEALATLKDLAVNGLTKQLASDYQAVVDDAISDLNSYRGDIGSTQNQVESAVRNLMTQATNVKAAESIIRDVDYAAESANFNKQNIIAQAGTYAISQANSSQQNVLRLLQ